MEAHRHLPWGWKAVLRYKPLMNEGCKKENGLAARMAFKQAC
jgi:hypothetical protein